MKRAPKVLKLLAKQLSREIRPLRMEDLKLFKAESLPLANFLGDARGEFYNHFVYEYNVIHFNGST